MKIPQSPMGRQGFVTSQQGLGCMGEDATESLMLSIAFRDTHHYLQGSACQDDSCQDTNIVLAPGELNFTM